VLGTRNCLCNQLRTSLCANLCWTQAKALITRNLLWLPQYPLLPPAQARLIPCEEVLVPAQAYFYSVDEPFHLTCSYSITLKTISI
jgi:hypothetical protein